MVDELLEAFAQDAVRRLAAVRRELEDQPTNAAADPALVDRMFRVTHSVKGSSAYLGLAAMGAVAHRLESLLHLLRDGQMVLCPEVVDGLLRGFQRLERMAAELDDDQEQPVDGLVDDLARLLPPLSRRQANCRVDLATRSDRPGFVLDGLTLTQALCGGQALYEAEYDLLRDIQRRGLTPLEVLRRLQERGLIVDCRLDMAAAGTLESGHQSRLPFLVLFAGRLEPDTVVDIFQLPAERIHRLEPPPVRPVVLGRGFRLETEQADARLQLHGPGDVQAALELRDRLREVLPSVRRVWLHLGEAEEYGLAMHQVLLAARQSLLLAGGELRLEEPVSESVREVWQVLGFGPGGGLA